MSDYQSNNKRIAKNTIVLYARTLLTMVVALFTSRVVLNALGVENYGIYNVVGGFVGMLSILSGSLSSAISRFITYELGKGDKLKLGRIFSSSLNIQIAMAFVVAIVGEIVGVWFLNSHLNIPADRLSAANWVFHCSLLVFIFNLLYVPYNACIIAHEKMTAFAYMSIIDVTFKLAIAYLILVSPWDRLSFYSIALLVQSVLMTSVYMIYCLRKFEECKYKFCHEKGLLKEMMSFAGWTFFTGGAAIFNTTGLNILINIFFGVTLNAARGIASQVEGVLMRFVSDFTTAINPQITKSYAAGEIDFMNILVCRGAKFSFLLLFFLVLPFMFEAEMILTLWLKMVPEHTVTFFRLTMIGAMVNILGYSGYTACMATGDIKRYTVIITSVGFLVFPLTWIAFALGLPAEACYVIYILVYSAILFVRLWIMQGLMNFPVMLYIREVIAKISSVVLLALPLPLIVYFSLDYGVIRFFLCSFICVLSSITSIYAVGLSTSEKQFIQSKLKQIVNKFK